MAFRINRTDLRAMVARVDDGYSIGPPRSVIVEFPDHLLGGPDRWEDPRQPVYEDPAILGCGCGSAGCAAVLVTIDVKDEAVSWSNFRLDRNRQRLDLGPFHLARRAYTQAVDELRRPVG